MELNIVFNSIAIVPGILKVVFDLTIPEAASSSILMIYQKCFLLHSEELSVKVKNVTFLNKLRNLYQSVIKTLIKRFNYCNIFTHKSRNINFKIILKLLILNIYLKGPNFTNLLLLTKSKAKTFDK